MTLELIAYYLYDGEPTMKLVPAPRSRDWMDETPRGFARRCLPLLLANQSGYWILNNREIRVTWHGGMDKHALSVAGEGSSDTGYALSHFGSGILTFQLPYLFRTLPGYNLLARGPANMPKDGAYALEGLIETDWTCSTFTMNWKMTRPGLPVTFAVDEPICMIVPQKRGEIETFVPQVRHMSENASLQSAYNEWSASRATFNAELFVPGSEAAKREWQKDYFRSSHQTKLSLKEFRPVEPH